MLERLKATGQRSRVNVTTPIDSTDARAAALNGDEWLVSRREPVLLIDPATHRLVASNASGAACLGIGDARSIDFDPSMPGWGPIKAYAESGPDRPPREETMLFWAPAGPRALKGRMETVRHNDRTLVLITVEPTTGPGTLAARAPQSAAQQDDLATLREIARRIRAGGQAEGPARETTAGYEAGARAAAAKDPASPPPVVPEPSATAGPAPLRFPPPLDFRQAPGPTADPATGDPKQGTDLVHSNGPSALAKLAHELRTPLSAIVSLAEIMRDEQLGAMGNQRYKAYAADIHESARHTLELVGAMVETEREAANGDHPHLDFSPVDINEIARSCASAMKPIASRGDVSLDTKLQPHLPRIAANRRAIRQIILNLLSNALRFTPHGGRITIATTLAADRMLRLEVADTGKGMRPEDIARIVGPLHGESATDSRPQLPTTNGGSTGIGLPLVRQLAGAHGATLSIESEPERGTQILITFPPDRVTFE